MIPVLSKLRRLSEIGAMLGASLQVGGEHSKSLPCRKVSRERESMCSSRSRLQCVWERAQYRVSSSSSRNIRDGWSASIAKSGFFALKNARFCD